MVEEEEEEEEEKQRTVTPPPLPPRNKSRRARRLRRVLPHQDARHDEWVDYTCVTELERAAAALLEVDIGIAAKWNTNRCRDEEEKKEDGTRDAHHERDNEDGSAPLWFVDESMSLFGREFTVEKLLAHRRKKERDDDEGGRWSAMAVPTETLTAHASCISRFFDCAGLEAEAHQRQRGACATEASFEPLVVTPESWTRRVLDASLAVQILSAGASGRGSGVVMPVHARSRNAFVGVYTHHDTGEVYRLNADTVFLGSSKYVRKNSEDQGCILVALRSMWWNVMKDVGVKGHDAVTLARNMGYRKRPAPCRHRDGGHDDSGVRDTFDDEEGDVYEPRVLLRMDDEIRGDVQGILAVHGDCDGDDALPWNAHKGEWRIGLREKPFDIYAQDTGSLSSLLSIEQLASMLFDDSDAGPTGPGRDEDSNEWDAASRIVESTLATSTTTSLTPLANDDWDAETKMNMSHMAGTCPRSSLFGRFCHELLTSSRWDRLRSNTARRALLVSSWTSLVESLRIMYDNAIGHDVGILLPHMRPRVRPELSAPLVSQKLAMLQESILRCTSSSSPSSSSPSSSMSPVSDAIFVRGSDNERDGDARRKGETTRQRDVDLPWETAEEEMQRRIVALHLGARGDDALRRGTKKTQDWTKEGAKAIHYLETVEPNELLPQLLAVACASAVESVLARSSCFRAYADVRMDTGEPGNSTHTVVSDAMDAVQACIAMATSLIRDTSYTETCIDTDDASSVTSSKAQSTLSVRPTGEWWSDASNVLALIARIRDAEIAVNRARSAWLLLRAAGVEELVGAVPCRDAAPEGCWIHLKDKTHRRAVALAFSEELASAPAVVDYVLHVSSRSREHRAFAEVRRGEVVLATRIAVPSS